MKHALHRATALAALMTLVAATVLPAAAADPYDVNVILNLTGPGAFLGKAEELTLQLLEKRVNATGGISGRPVRFVLHDDQSNPANTVQLMNQIIGGKSSIVLGSTLAATCLATTPLVKSGPVEYCYSPSIYPAAGSYVFSSGIATKDVALAYARYFKSRGWKRVAIITSTDASGQDADESFARALAAPKMKDSGVEFVSQQHFNGADLSVAAQMANIKNANPNVVIAYAPGTPFGTLLRGVQQASITAPIVTGTGNMSYAEMKQYADALPKDLYFPGLPLFAAEAAGSKLKLVEADFFNAFKAAGVKPDQLHTFAWDSTSIAIEALRKLGPTATAEQIRAHIAGLTDYQGVGGHFDFRDSPQRGLSVKDVMIVRWDAGKANWAGVSDLGGFNGR